MAKLSEVKYLCPNCNAPILHEIPENGKESEYEICPMCRTKTLVKDLDSKPTYSKGGASEVNYTGAVSSETMVAYMDEAESALAYVESYFTNYDWDDFMYTSALSVPEIDKVVDKMLMKSGAKPAAWELQFMAINEPLLKKLGDLNKLENKFFDEYIKNDDPSESFSYFDTYKRIVNKIVANKDEILKKLSTAIKFYKKYLKQGEESVLPTLTVQLSTLEQKLNAVKPVEDYKELPGYAAAKAAKQNRVVQKLAAKGIDAEQVYADAVATFNAGGDLRSTLAKFNSIAGYKDASEYAAKVDAWLQFTLPSVGAFLRLGKKYYKIEKAAAPAMQMNNLNNSAREQAQQPAAASGRTLYNMYEIVDKKRAAEPCVRDITNILYHFGGTVFYVKKGEAIYSFNSEAAGTLDKGESDNVTETFILKFRPGDICFDILNKYRQLGNDLFVDSDMLFIKHDKLYLRQKLNAIVKEEKKGCLGGLFGKKEPEIKVVNKNNYALIAINLVNSAIETVIRELVDIHCIYENEIFYDCVTTSEGKDNDVFYAYNHESGENRTVLNAETEIVDVVGGKAVYFLQSPNDYNKDLYIYDFATGASRLMETNVYDYFASIDGMLYYYIGNEDVKTLYRVNVDGTGKLEIRNNAENFERDHLMLRNSWLYFINGYGRNLALDKMSADGKKYIRLCGLIKDLVTFKDGYIYYVDQFNTLCMVREDGSGKKEIIENVEDFIEVTDSAIYLLREEIVDETDTEYIYSKSLYSVDFDGCGLKKIAFNVANAAMSPSNRDEIYLYKTDKVSYKIQIPVDKNNYNTVYETRVVKTIILYNIGNGKFREVAILDTPDNSSFTFKGGCFKKPVTKDLIITEIPHKRTYKRGGLMKAGQVADEQKKAMYSNSSVSNTSRSTGSTYSPSRAAGRTSFTNAQSVKTSIAMVVTTFLYMLTMLFVDVPSAMTVGVGAIFLVANALLAVVNVAKAYKTKQSTGKLDSLYAAAVIVSVIGVVLSIVTMVI